MEDDGEATEVLSRNKLQFFAFFFFLPQHTRQSESITNFRGGVCVTVIITETKGKRPERMGKVLCASITAIKKQKILFLICRRHKIYSFGRIVYFFSARLLGFFFSFRLCTRFSQKVTRAKGRKKKLLCRFSFFPSPPPPSRLPAFVSARNVMRRTRKLRDSNECLARGGSVKKALWWLRCLVACTKSFYYYLPPRFTDGA